MVNTALKVKAKVRPGRSQPRPRP